MSGYVSFNVHAHGDTIVSIYTGGLCVIAHKEKKNVHAALLDSRKNTSGGIFFFLKKESTLKLPFTGKRTVSCSGGIANLFLKKQF